MPSSCLLRRSERDQDGHADRPSPGSQILHNNIMFFTSKITRDETIDHDTTAATIHLAQWRNDSTFSPVALKPLVTAWFLYIKAPVSKTCDSLSWRKIHSRVGGTFPVLILVISRLCRLACYYVLVYGVIRCHYPCIGNLNIMCRSQKIPGVGCQETPLDR
jgi:hypothetical protein